MYSELTPRARIPDTRIPQLMQPWYSIPNLSILKMIRLQYPELVNPLIERITQIIREDWYTLSTASIGGAMKIKKVYGQENGQKSFNRIKSVIQLIQQNFFGCSVII